MSSFRATLLGIAIAHPEITQSQLKETIFVALALSTVRKKTNQNAQLLCIRLNGLCQLWG
jgi:hypothetical protein